MPSRRSNSGPWSCSTSANKAHVRARTPISYGTLQQSEVQLATYGRELEGEPDVLPGYVLELVEIAREDVVELSGKAIHTIARATGDPADRIAGVVFFLSAEELVASDAYEDSSYRRMEVRLESGETAWAYVA